MFLSEENKNSLKQLLFGYNAKNHITEGVSINNRFSQIWRTDGEL
jgi:hypothetical protein